MLSECPFHEAIGETCFLARTAFQETGHLGSQGLVTASLEIGRALVVRNRVLFAAKGYCMYPCIKQGDILHIESCPVEEAKVGDIAVIRRDGTLLGHRIIAKGVDESHGVYVVTRPDRSSHGSDGPTWQGDLLGVVCAAERRGRALSLTPLRLQGFELFKVSIWEWWNCQTKPAIVNFLGHVQHLSLYHPLSTAWLSWRYPYPFLSVRIPLNSRQKTDFHQLFPASGFDLRSVRQQGGEVVAWTIQMELQKKVLAAWVTLVRRPDGCPEGGGWDVWRSWCRFRYRGAGLEARLVEEARAILERSGASLR